MTPIQTHETELRAMMERAGLAVDSIDTAGLKWRATKDGWLLTFHDWKHEGTIECSWREGEDASRDCSAEHPDPRIALRHCLEMAGLLTDRPPQTDEELVQWLTDRAGPADFMNRWSHNDYIIRQLDHVWVYWHQGRPLQRSAYARELGAMLWCAERFPEVNP
jgi:hypothetical protein